MNATSAPALRATGVHLPSRIFIDDFRVEPGECVVLCGPNGSGKSSLLRLLAGLESHHTGTVRLGNTNIHSLSRPEIASHLAWLPQRPLLADTITCLDIVTSARYRFSESTRRAREIAQNALETQSVGHLAGRRADHVSGGELQRVLLASLIAQDVPFLLVDEPANHLDPGHQVATYQRLGELWRSGKGVLIVSHDVRLAQLLGDADQVRIACVQDHKLTKETRLSDPNLSSDLKTLYGVDFIPQGKPASLAVRLT